MASRHFVDVGADAPLTTDAGRRAERNALILSNVHDALVVTDMAGVITYWNAGAERLFGWTAEEMVGQPYAVRFPPAIRKWIEAEIAARGQGTEWDGEFHDYRKDGTRVWIDSRVKRITDASGTPIGILGISHDISERKRLEEQLRQAQKMEAVGRLAGGVSHDFNNLLMVINGYTELLRVMLRNHDAAREMLDAVHQAGDKAAGLTQQLLAYSRKQILQPKVLDLGEVVEEARRMLERIIGEDVHLTVTSNGPLHAVRADPGQVTQVLMNLCVNARDAMPTGGALDIEIRNAAGFEAAVPGLAEPPVGQYVLLSVADTGCGMDPETQRHIFEPFFTTKQPGHGTGLGLATVYGIVKQSGGFIRAESEVGRGSRFCVYLPAVEGDGGGAAARAGEPLRGSETVLLVEDEPGVRLLAKRMLERSGYHVLVAESGAEAVEIGRGYDRAIDVVLTDVVMPRMSGRQVADALRQSHPESRVLFMSGYTDDAVVRHGISGSEATFLQKPFGTNDLLAKVRAVLDGDRRE